MAGEIILITGGARSGKSGFAQRLADEMGGPVTYVATATASDEEMTARIAKHRADRPATWRTVETYRQLDQILAGVEGAVLVDCLTLMTTNLMMDAGLDYDTADREALEAVEGQVRGEVSHLLRWGRARSGRLILVSNELGMGLVPVYRFGRVFRDIAGRVNQQAAEAADRVVLMVSGIPVTIKGVRA
ncbi:MAG: bifunctional adenosylcobinamide kinase/adenosylcobinamide-phosphate guanylyltransferase [Christensenellales bacterium]|jgi:adenosylcobinamide kinase/adenosylcobinamide-phosphate guanylyltransferase